METVKRKPGRPMLVGADGKRFALTFNWFGVKDKEGVGVPAFQWPNYTDSELRRKISVTHDGVTYNPSVVAVFLKRQKMLKDNKKVACKKAKYTRSRFVTEANAAKKAAKKAA